MAEILGEGSEKFREVYGVRTQFVSPIISKHYLESDYLSAEATNIVRYPLS